MIQLNHHSNYLNLGWDQSSTPFDKIHNLNMGWYQSSIATPFDKIKRQARHFHKHFKCNPMGLTLSNGSTNFQDSLSEWKVRVTSPTWSNKRVELKMEASPSKGEAVRDVSPTTQSFPSLSIHNGRRVKETRWWYVYPKIKISKFWKRLKEAFNPRWKKRFEFV